MGKTYNCDKCNKKIEEHSICSATIQDDERPQSKLSRDPFIHEYELCKDCAVITIEYITAKPTKNEKMILEKYHARLEELERDRMYND